MDASTETIVKMLEPLSEDSRQRVVREMSVLVAGIMSEKQWDTLFHSREDGLARAARQAKGQIRQGLAKPTSGTGPEKRIGCGRIPRFIHPCISSA